jgi:SAM-dependent methyltransferase
VKLVTDPILGVDWAEHWRGLVRDRATEDAAHREPGYWDRRARIFARSTAVHKDRFLDVLEPYLGSRKTVIDVGAGAGRHAVPLSEKVEWVTAVEPSEGMRALMPPRDNMTIVAAAWLDAEIAPADLVICAHVLYPIEDVVPFIAKMEATARERVFIVLREGQLKHPAMELWELRMGRPRVRMPQFSDLFMLLRSMGVAPEVSWITYQSAERYADMEDAVADTKLHLGSLWEDTTGRDFLEQRLTRQGDEFIYDRGDTLAGIAHWRPRAAN